MCEPATIALATTIFQGVGALGTLATVFGGSKSAPARQAPMAPPESQAAKTPEQNVLKKKIIGAMGGGADPTLLTGAGGISNSALTLGKNTLLGA